MGFSFSIKQTCCLLFPARAHLQWWETQASWVSFPVWLGLHFPSPTITPHTTHRKRQGKDKHPLCGLKDLKLRGQSCFSTKTAEIPKDSVQFSSVAQSCPTLCDPMNRSTPGLPVHNQLPEFTQTQVHQVGDATEPSHPLLSPSPPALNPSQHQSLFQ